MPIIFFLMPIIFIFLMRIPSVTPCHGNPQQNQALRNAWGLKPGFLLLSIVLEINFNKAIFGGSQGKFCKCTSLAQVNLEVPPHLAGRLSGRLRGYSPDILPSEEFAKRKLETGTSSSKPFIFCEVYSPLNTEKKYTHWNVMLLELMVLESVNDFNAIYSSCKWVT